MIFIKNLPWVLFAIFLNVSWLIFSCGDTTPSKSQERAQLRLRKQQELLREVESLALSFAAGNRAILLNKQQSSAAVVRSLLAQSYAEYRQAEQGLRDMYADSYAQETIVLRAGVRLPPIKTKIISAPWR